MKPANERVCKINQMADKYFFTGTTSQTCGWTGQDITFKWNITPSEFSIVDDTTFSNNPFSLAIYAKPGVVTTGYSNNDTTTVTLLDKNLLITTPAGTFTCDRYKYTEPDSSGIYRITKTTYFWLNVKYGIIKQEVANPVDPTDIQLQVLFSKNF